MNEYAFFVLYQAHSTNTQPDDEASGATWKSYTSWDDAKKRRDKLFENLEITVCWVEKRWHNEPWNTRRWGHVLRRGSTR